MPNSLQGDKLKVSTAKLHAGMVKLAAKKALAHKAEAKLAAHKAASKEKLEQVRIAVLRGQTEPSIPRGRVV